MKTKILYSLVLYLFTSLISSPFSNTTEMKKSQVNDFWKWEKQYIKEPNAETWTLKSETTTHFIFIKKEFSENQTHDMLNKVAADESNKTNPLCNFTNSEFVINMNGFKAEQMIISDLLGIIYYSKSLKDSEKQFSINVNNYPNGAYLVLFTDKDNSKFVFKFVKN